MRPEKTEKPLFFRRDRRVTSGLDFERIYGLRVKAADSHLVIFGAVNDLGRTRIGLSVSKRNGNSVKRHRLRRLLREAYRLEQHSIEEGFDLILIPGRDAATGGIDAIRLSLRQLAKRLSRRLTQSPPPGN